MAKKENSKDSLIEVLEYFKAMKFDHMLTHTSMLLAACTKPMFIPQEQIDVDTKQDDNQTISAIAEIEQLADQTPKYNKHGSLTNLYNTFIHCRSRRSRRWPAARPTRSHRVCRSPA